MVMASIVHNWKKTLIYHTLAPKIFMGVGKEETAFGEGDRALTPPASRSPLGSMVVSWMALVH